MVVLVERGFVPWRSKAEVDALPVVHVVAQKCRIVGEELPSAPSIRH